MGKASIMSGMYGKKRFLRNKRKNKDSGTLINKWHKIV